jgi:hypothetical protein
MPGRDRALAALAERLAWSSDKKFRQSRVPKGSFFPILPVIRKMPPLRRQKQ